MKIGLVTQIDLSHIIACDKEEKLLSPPKG